jgi:AcrR family transcriptional regulator
MAGRKEKKLKRGTLPAHAPEWTTLFLLTLSSTGNVAAACRAANVPRRTVYNHYRDYPEFTEVWDDAREESLDKLEGLLWKQGAEGNTRAIEFVLRGRRSDIFGEGRNSVNVQVNNNISLEEERRLSEETHVLIDQITGRMTEHKMIEDVVDEDTKESD